MTEGMRMVVGDRGKGETYQSGDLRSCGTTQLAVLQSRSLKGRLTSITIVEVLGMS